MTTATGRRKFTNVWNSSPATPLPNRKNSGPSSDSPRIKPVQTVGRAEHSPNVFQTVDSQSQ